MTPRKKEISFVELPISTSDGKFVARYSPNGLAELSFPAKQRAKTVPPKGAAPAQVRRWHRATIAALKRALVGRALRALPPLDVSSGTEFQQRVWRALRTIPCGQTRSYGEIAGQIGKPKAMRAVGAACGANPIPLFIPCHRVLAANRKPGGYSAGLSWKRKLLTREGIRMNS